MKAIPPTTPPTIAPMGFGGAGVWPGKSPMFMQIVEAQAVQDSAFREQVWPAPQGGQLGVPEGHFTQRRNMVRR